jgi:hypothetical protein
LEEKREVEKMVTASDLQRFETENGLTHPPYINLETAASEINANGGMCPAEGVNRRCPCTECIDEMADSDDSRAACRKFFFVEPRYAEFFKDAWKKYQRKKDREVKQGTWQEPTPTIQTQEEQAIDENAIEDVDENSQVTIEKIANLVDTLKEARQLVKDGDYGDANDRLIDEAVNQGCDSCVKYLEAEAAMCLAIDKMCASDEQECAYETHYAVNRLTDMILMYIKIDQDLSNDPNAGVPDLSNITAGDQAPIRTLYKDGHKKCLAATMRQLKESGEPNQHKNMATANKLCTRMRHRNDGRTGQEDTEDTDNQ